MSTIDLDAILARADVAGKGPWTVGVRWFDGRWNLPINSPSTNEDDPHQPDRVALISYDAGGFQYPHADAKADAEFIAAAREDVPALLAEVKRLREVLNKRIEERNWLLAKVGDKGREQWFKEFGPAAPSEAVRATSNLGEVWP